MLRLTVSLLICLQYATLLVESAKQQVQLSDSYLPVAMQVIAHLTDQMAYEAKDEPTKPSTKPTSPPPYDPTTKPTWQQPTNKPTNTWPKPTNKPTNTWQKPTSKPTNTWPKPTTPKPYVFPFLTFNPANTWWMKYGLLDSQATTPFHRPGLYAPVVPPRLGANDIPKTGFVLLPFDYNAQYTVIEPQEKRTEEPLLSMHEEEVRPLMEPAKEEPLLPPNFDAEVDKISRKTEEEITDENLQYLSLNVRDLIKMANDPDDERVVDVWEGVRANNKEITPKAKLSASNLRLLLLYDLLSREAKRQRLSDYSGFSPDVMKNLVDSSSGGARAQLSLALSRMVDRHDCEHEYANNRAKEMVKELAKDDSTLSNELRYLQPLVYKY